MISPEKNAEHSFKDVEKCNDQLGKNNRSNSILLSFDGIQDEAIEKVSKDGVDTESTDDKIKGITYMMIAGVSFSLGAIACKFAYNRNEYLTGIDYILCRSLTLIICSLIQVMSTRVNVLDVKKGYRALLAIRCIIGAIGMPCFFIAMKYIPLSLSTLIFNIHPLFVGILAYFILNENLTKLKILAVCGALVGVYLLTLHKSGHDQQSKHYTLGICLVSITCVCASIVSIMLRVLNKEIHFAMSPFWFSATTLVMSLSLLCVYPAAYNFAHYTYSEISLFLISGFFNYGGQMFKSLAFKYSDASLVSPLQYFNVLYLFLSDIIIFKSTFTAFDGLGGMIILVSLLMPIFYTIHLKYSKSKELAG
ncbi:unnamed protein product [Moneuplotes crassus]|uniref:EamA domain-containing protein n=1 Tax=Euplotes crassus TaxID=5936 RepID=A0AAD1XEV1_EUPCR|nr:unnamed protein product [Moneuplotes crassus]